MRVSLTVPDRPLRRALSALLEQYGHDIVAAGADPDLALVQDPSSAEPVKGAATLYLRPAPFRRPDPNPRTSLQEALATRGVVTWDSPLDVRALIEALGGGPVTHRRRRGPPDLGTAPHAWLVVDPLTGATVSTSTGANTVMSERPLPEPLLARLTSESDGSTPVDIAGARQLVLWWTGRDGMRVVCLMPGLRLVDSADERHVRSLAEIGRMAATLAHEIRNPVASVAGALDLLEDVEDAEERVEIVRMARERLMQMRRLLDDTLRMARSIDGEPEPVEAQELVRSCVSALSTDPHFSGITVRVEAPAESVHVRAHLEPMQQALTNLLLNAAQAQQGTGTVTVSVRVDGPLAALIVEDEGPGIPPESREQVFQPFYTTKTEGTGLGLAFVRRVVEAAGGDIEIESRERGSAFVVTLPREP